MKICRSCFFVWILNIFIRCHIKLPLTVPNVIVWKREDDNWENMARRNHEVMSKMTDSPGLQTNKHDGASAVPLILTRRLSNSIYACSDNWKDMPCCGYHARKRIIAYWRSSCHGSLRLRQQCSSSNNNKQQHEANLLIWDCPSALLVSYNYTCLLSQSVHTGLMDYALFTDVQLMGRSKTILDGVWHFHNGRRT